MAKIVVAIRFAAAAEKVTVELPDNVPMKQMLPLLTERLQLPSFRYRYYALAGERFPS